MRTKLCFLPKISGVEVAPCLLPKISGVEVTPSVTSAESSEQFWRKIRQIWRICEPWLFLSFVFLLLLYYGHEFRFATCSGLALDRNFLSSRLSSAWCCLVCYIRSLLTAVPLLCWRVLWDWIRQCQLTSVCFKFRFWRGWSKYFSPALLIFQVSRWPDSPLMSSGQRKKIT